MTPLEQIALIGARLREAATQGNTKDYLAAAIEMGEVLRANGGVNALPEIQAKVVELLNAPAAVPELGNPLSGHPQTPEAKAAGDAARQTPPAEMVFLSAGKP